jgi:hypothetical protein
LVLFDDVGGLVVSIFKIELKKQPMSEKALKWYEYNQNNSGGYFVEPAQRVWVQGVDANDIVRRFESLDIDESFCDCCGLRWHHPFGDDDLTDEPEYYGEKLSALTEKPRQFGNEVPFGCLVYVDGTTKILTINEDNL